MKEKQRIPLRFEILSLYQDLPHLLSCFAQQRSLCKEQGQGKFNELQERILTS